MNDEYLCPKCKRSFTAQDPPKKLINCSHNMCHKCLIDELSTKDYMQFAQLIKLAQRKENTQLKLSRSTSSFYRQSIYPIILKAKEVKIKGRKIKLLSKAQTAVKERMNSQLLLLINIHQLIYLNRKILKKKQWQSSCLAYRLKRKLKIIQTD